MRALKFQVRKNDAGQYHWTLVAGNGKKIAWSAETYKTRAKCIHGLNLARRLARDARVVDHCHC